MSQANVEVVRAIFQAWNAGEMDAVREMHDPDVIMRMAEGWPESGPFVGREAFMRELERLRETFDADSLEPISDYINIGDRVVVRYRWRGAGHGPEASFEFSQVITLRRGRVIAIEQVWDHSEALEAVGLSE
jgi:ketosteroid isomerase-like protein